MNIQNLRKLEQSYKRISRPLEEILFPLILLLWPLIKYNQGIDVSDSTYSLSNYLFAGRLRGVWVMSTYLSNLLGSLLVRLPGGRTLSGINIYTGLVISAIALICYYGLRRELTAPVMFIGEFISISFCWIPSGILYNYLTYLLFNASAVVLYHAVRRQRSVLFYTAGIILGLNSFVRIPNVAEAALIIAVWVGLYTTAKREGATGTKAISEPVGMTGACVVGYIMGMAVPLILITIVYGEGSISELLTGLTAMSASNNEYTLLSMFLSVGRAYLRSLRWVLVMLAVIFAGTLMMAVLKQNAALKWAGRAVYAAVLGIMLRFFWGRGMYSYRFYEDYTSVYEWGMTALVLAWICVITVLLRHDYNPLLKTMAAVTLVMLIITPVGSNNYTMQNINNLFLVMPFVIYIAGGWLYRGAHRIRLEGVMYGCNFPWMSMLIVILSMIMIQSAFFHKEFVFRDGMDGTPREVKILTASSASQTNNVADFDRTPLAAIDGMYTNAYNAGTLIGLCEYTAGRADIDSALYWGDCPGLAYILRLPMAIDTAWPDLESYTVDDFKSDLEDLAEDRYGNSADEHQYAVICRRSYHAEAESTRVKEKMLFDYITENDMIPVYENEEYTVYMTS